VNRELPDDVHSEVGRLSADGNSLVNDGDFAGAIAQFERALVLLPTPIEDWSAATWLLTAIGETYFFAEDFESARLALNRALLCPESLDNPLIWLRRGQVYFELGDTHLADDCLASAYMLGGDKVFEHEDPKYAEYIHTKLEKPENI
jgi:tetratricopeptide (TPR) repeat protein